MRSLTLRYEPNQARNSINRPQPTMIRNAKNGIATGGRSCAGKSVEPDFFRGEAHAADEAAEDGAR